MTLAAIVLAGGHARRLGGASKPDLIVGSDTLLDLALAACEMAHASPVIVVGPDALARAGVHITREEPAGSGPAAGIAAGLDALAALGGGNNNDFDPDDLVLALACDMPNAADAVPALVGAAASRVGIASGDGVVSGDGIVAGTSDGAWLVNDMGRTQPLLAVYRARSLAHAVQALPRLGGASMGQLTGALDMTPVLGLHHASDDVDTWQDADRWGARPWPAALGEDS